MKGCISCEHADPALFLNPIRVDCAKLGRRVDERHDGCDHWNSCQSLKKQVVAHWRRMHDAAPGVFKSHAEKPDIENCPYCEKFWLSDCRGCPIAKVAGQIVCRNTPYALASNAYVCYYESGWAEEYKADWQIAAVKMIEFLKGLPDEQL